MKKTIGVVLAILVLLITASANVPKEKLVGYWEVAYFLKEGQNEPRDVREVAFYFYEDGAMEIIDLRRTKKEVTSWKLKSGDRLKIDLEDDDFKKPFKIIEFSDDRMVWELNRVKVYLDKGTE